MNSILECSICSKILKQPVMLPCGCTICKHHEDDEREKCFQEISCLKCQIQHEFPLQGFPTNSMAVKLLEFKLTADDLASEHKVAIDSFNDLKKLVDDLKRIRDHPEYVLNSFVADLKNKIDSRREEAKKEIDDEAMMLIAELDQYESMQKARMNPNELVLSKETSNLLESIEKDLSKWSLDLNIFCQNIKGLKEIHLDLVMKYRQLRKECFRVKKSLFTDKLFELESKQKKFCTKTLPQSDFELFYNSPISFDEPLL